MDDLNSSYSTLGWEEPRSVLYSGLDYERWLGYWLQTKEGPRIGLATGQL